ncbi:MAG: hypothetical protein LCH95_01980 [Proteobacteria bacterium]|nr:hypothetical protein [Pseudomonadota bacterium]
MNKTFAAVAVATAFGTLSSSWAADGKVPDLTGTWMGKSLGLSVGAGRGPRPKDGTWEKPAFHEGTVTTKISKQDGRYIWGIREFDNGFKTNFIGMIDESLGGIVIISDTGAHYWGKLVDANRIETCLAHAPQPDDRRFDVSCSTWVRGK